MSVSVSDKECQREPKGERRIRISCTFLMLLTFSVENFHLFFSHIYFNWLSPNGYHVSFFRKQRKKNKKTVFQQFKGSLQTQLLKLFKVCFIKALYQVVFGAKSGERFSLEWLPDQNIVLLTFLCILHHFSCILYCHTSQLILSIKNEATKTKQTKKKDKQKKWKKRFKKFLKRSLKGAKKGMKSASTVASHVVKKASKVQKYNDPIEGVLMLLYKTLSTSLFKMVSNCLKKRKMPRVKHLFKQLRIGISCVGLPTLFLFIAMYIASLRMPAAVQPIKIGFICIQIFRAVQKDIIAVLRHYLPVSPFFSLRQICSKLLQALWVKRVQQTQVSDVQLTKSQKK